jgi:hypothetical protein
VTLRVRCSNGHSLSVKDELAGQRVRCPKCKVLFRAQPDGAEEDESDEKAPPRPSKKRKKPDRERRPPPPEEDDGDSGESGTPEERRRERQRDKKDRLAKVSIGLLLHIIKLWALVVLVFFIFLSSVFYRTIEFSKMPGVTDDLGPDAIIMFVGFLGICILIILGLVVVMPIIGLAGSAFACLIPKKSEARGTIITSLVFDLVPLLASIGIILALVDVFGSDPEKKDRLLYMLVAGSVFFSIAALFLFVIFTRLLGYYIQKPLLAAEALNLVSWLMIMVCAAPVALLAMKYLSPMIVPAIGSTLNMIVMFIITLIWFAMYYIFFFQAMLRLLSAERAAIADS